MTPRPGTRFPDVHVRVSADGYLVTADGDPVGSAASRPLAEALADVLRAIPSLLPRAREAAAVNTRSLPEVTMPVTLYKPYVPTSPAEVAVRLRALGIRCAYQHSHGCIYGAMGDRQFAVGTADGDSWGVTVRAEIGGTDDPVFDTTVAPEGAPATLIAVAVATALLSLDETSR